MDQEEIDYVIEHCCSFCGFFIECADPENPQPGGNCDIDDDYCDKDDDDDEEAL